MGGGGERAWKEGSHYCTDRVVGLPQAQGLRERALGCLLVQGNLKTERGDQHRKRYLGLKAHWDVEVMT